MTIKQLWRKIFPPYVPTPYVEPSCIEGEKHEWGVYGTTEVPYATGRYFTQLIWICKKCQNSKRTAL